MKDGVKLSGTLNLTLSDSAGKIVKDITTHNLVVTVGKEWVADLMQSGTGTPMSHMAIGSSTTDPATSDTTLGIEESRVALTVAGGTRTGAAIEYIGIYPAGTGTATLTEAGLFNANSGGTMLSRTEFAAISKGASDTLTITWTVSVG
jgi:hypothetical protein